MARFENRRKGFYFWMDSPFGCWRARFIIFGVPREYWRDRLRKLKGLRV